MNTTLASTRPARRSRLVVSTLAGIAALGGAAVVTLAPSFASAGNLPIANPTTPTNPPLDPNLPIANPTTPPNPPFDPDLPIANPTTPPNPPFDPDLPLGIPEPGDDDPTDPADPADPADPGTPESNVPAGQLPETGAETGVIALLGVALTAGGAALVTVSRRRTA